ncbi:MAG: hypothetical protein AB7S71_14050 [Dongiaceae bacterium]
MTRALFFIFVAICMGLASSSSAVAAETDPDWPCVQRKVPEISSGQVWTGPPLDGVGASWLSDDALAQLARAIASRRTEMADAKQKIAAFAASATDRNRRLTELFAGVLATLNAERRSIMAGIGRYAHRQQALARKISAQAAELDKLAAQGGTDDQAGRQAELQEVQDWDQRIFRERERSLQYVCELPVLIEQRAFALGREFSGLLDK